MSTLAKEGSEGFALKIELVESIEAAVKKEVLMGDLKHEVLTLTSEFATRIGKQ